MADAPLLRYHGGKYALAGWIIGHFTEHRVYVEPFGGGGAVLLAKEPSRMEVYNDIDEEVVNLFRVLRDDYYELLEALEYTCWSPKELELAYEPAHDPVERARRYYVRNWMSIAPADDKPSFRRQYKLEGGMTPAVGTWQRMGHLHEISQRLREVVIERDGYVRICRKYDHPDALFYVDPPYVLETRSRKNYYANEFTDEDHMHLLNVLNHMEAKVLLSAYPHDLYDELLPGWSWECRATMSRTQGRNKEECLWLNPKAATALYEKELPLFTQAARNIEALKKKFQQIKDQEDRMP